MDILNNKPDVVMEPRKSPHRMSIQWQRTIEVPQLQRLVTEIRKSKSLPNIRIESLSSCHRPSASPTYGEPSDMMCKKRQCISSSHHSVVSPSGHHNKPKILKKTWDKVKTIIHNPPSVRRESLVRKSEPRAPLQRSNAFTYSAPATPLDNNTTFEFEEDQEGATGPGDEKQRIARNYALLQKRLSEELHQRMSECGKTGGGGGLGDESYLSSGARAMYCSGGGKFPEHLSDEFRKRLQQWEMWKASTGKAHYTDEELKEIVPEEFGRKLLEWEVIRSGGGGQLETSVSVGSPEVVDSPATDPLIDESRRSSKQPKKKFNLDLLPQTQHQKELAWLDKQLEKIEVEKKRLEREMKKYLEREARLEKMKLALKNSPSSSNVYIKTPTAKCRVEKITEKFAKKLYEWEEKQGIGPESSALGLLNPKYYENDEEKDDVLKKQNEKMNEETAPEEVENREVLKDEDDGGDDGDVEEDEEVIGPLDLINARMKAAAENQEESEQDKSVRRAMEHVAEALALAEEDVVVGIVREGAGGRVSSTASSCCCSAEYEYDQTDSFATKNNSGASNTTDSEFYPTRPDPHKIGTNTRRRSSDAISTPLSGDARSPSLSAFTSDDECDNGPVLLKRVSEEQDNDSCQNVSRHSTIVRNNAAEVEQVVRDAESQTDVVVKAKQIVVEEDEINGNDESGRDNSGIFVQTKRTIFAPIVGDIDSEKVVLISEDDATNKQEETAFAFSSIPSISSPPFENMEGEDEEDDKPKVVGAIPKRPTNLNIRVDSTPTSGFQTRTGYKLQPKTQFHRSFPKMGKIPVWCSPLVARKQFSSGQEQEQACGSSSGVVSVTTPDDSDFSIDRFLHDSKLLDAAMNTNVSRTENQVGEENSVRPVTDLPLKKPMLCSRLPRTNAFLPRKYTIGGGYPPRGNGRSLTRSNSFGYPKASSGSVTSSSGCGGANTLAANLNDECAGGSNITLESFASSTIRLDQNLLHQNSVSGSMHSVTKSKSTGSIKSKFGRAFAKVGLGFGKDKRGGAPKEREGLADEVPKPEANVAEQAEPLNLGGGEEGQDQNRRGSGEGTGNRNPLRRFGSWVSKVGLEHSSSSGKLGGGGNKKEE